MINYSGIMSPNNYMDRTGVALGSAAIGAYGGKKQRQAAKRESGLARAERAEQNKLLEKQKEEYRAMEFTNPYAGMENQYAENVYEDLTVNQQQAQFQSQQGAQQRSNILGGLKGAAGGSGIAGLAQAMANQGQLQTQQISASIGQQEARNQQLKGKGALQVQAGAAAVDTAIRGGDAMVQQAESGRQATLLGMQQGQAAGANQAAIQAGMNQQAANASANSMLTDSLTGLAKNEDVQNLFKKKTPSDRKLKKNINLIGSSLSGLNIYSFEYKDSSYGNGLFQGVMSDEIPRQAIFKVDGYDHVDYSMLDVEFKQI